MSDRPPPPSENRLLEADMLLSEVYKALVDMWRIEIYDTDEIKSVSETVSYIRELLDTIGSGTGDLEYERAEEQDAAERIRKWEQEREQEREQEPSTTEQEGSRQ